MPATVAAVVLVVVVVVVVLVTLACAECLESQSLPHPRRSLTILSSFAERGLESQREGRNGGLWSMGHFLHTCTSMHLGFPLKAVMRHGPRFLREVCFENTAGIDTSLGMVYIANESRRLTVRSSLQKVCY